MSAGPRAAAAASVSPTVASGGEANTAVATLSSAHCRGLGPNSASASAWPSAVATGVRFSRLVTSPMA